MLARLDDLLFTLALARQRGDAVAVYDRLAPRYERIHGRWLRAGGAEALAALEGCLAAELRPGARVLDAACGTGTLASWIVEHEPRVTLTMLDAAPGMLERAAAVPGRRVHGDLGALPFADGAFDIVTCAWALESVADPASGLSELRRVLTPGGLLAYCFCTAPRTWSVRARSLPMRLAIERIFGGRFLRADFSPGLDDARARLVHGRRGLATFACYRKPTQAAAGLR